MYGLIIALSLTLAQLGDGDLGADLPTVADADLQSSVAQSKPAYLLVMARNLDREALTAYNVALPEVYEHFGGVYLAVQGVPSVLVAEGAFGFETVALSRWPSMDAIRAYWASPEYGEIRRLREGYGEFQILAFEGLPPEPPQKPDGRQEDDPQEFVP